MTDKFKYGEYFFERTYTQNTKPFNGLGPLYVRNSCMSCHPGYGHGKRMERYRADDWGNGYLLVVTDHTDTYLSSLTGMPQTKATAPFKAPIDEDKINIEWLDYTDEWGNKFPDGETYSLIYPEVTIPEDAYYVPLEVNGKTVDYANVKVRLESTIGIYGTGLIDAIPDDSLKAEYIQPGKSRCFTESQLLCQWRMGENLWQHHSPVPLYLCTEPWSAARCGRSQCHLEYYQCNTQQPSLSLYDTDLCQYSGK